MLCIRTRLLIADPRNHDWIPDPQDWSASPRSGRQCPYCRRMGWIDKKRDRDQKLAWWWKGFPWPYYAFPKVSRRKHEYHRRNR